MDRPMEIQSTTKRIKTGCGKLYLTKSLNSELYKEVFIRLGKAGGCASCLMDGVARLISLAKIPDEIILKAFIGIQCPHSTYDGGIEVLSCLDGIAKLLEATSKEVSEVQS